MVDKIILINDMTLMVTALHYCHFVIKCSSSSGSAASVPECRREYIDVCFKVVFLHIVNMTEHGRGGQVVICGDR